jgi:transposase InsO family protein
MADFAAARVVRWLRDASVGPAFIAPGRAWQNGIVERFDGKPRDEVLSREGFCSPADARMLIEPWRPFYNE